MLLWRENVRIAVVIRRGLSILASTVESILVSKPHNLFSDLLSGFDGYDHSS